MNEHADRAVVIVELVNRLALINPDIGTYCGYVPKGRGAVAKTTRGTILLKEALIKSQLSDPALIKEDDLNDAVSTFDKL